MIEEIETHGRNVLTGKPGKAKHPPPELCGTQPDEYKENTIQAPAQVGVDEASSSGSGGGQEQRLQHDATFATAAEAKEARKVQLAAALNSIRAGDIPIDVHGTAPDDVATLVNSSAP